MNELPAEILSIILNQLDLYDILNCKLVNKKFYSTILDYVRIKDELIVSDCDYSPLNRRWFFTYESVSLKNLIKCDCLNRTEFMLNQPIISNQLEQLYIYRSFISIELLNRFIKLQHLEINDSMIKIENCNVLKLPDLKIFNIKRPDSQNKNLTFDLPKLQKLQINEHDNFKLKDAKSLNYLESEFFSNCSNFIESAINLEHLYCKFIDLESLSDSLLQKLTKLKSICFYKYNDTFNELNRQKEQFNSDVKIYYLAVESNSPPDFQFSSCLNDKSLDYYIRNYDRIADFIPFIQSIDYNSLEKVSNQLPNDFLKKFVDLNRLFANEKINNVDYLISVLREFDTISHLKLNTTLSQNFYDNILFDLNPNIEALEIGRMNDEDEILNCEFLFKFKNIKTFCVEQQLSNDFLEKFSTTFTVFDKFEFKS